jgi:dimeric dUTPase (all-alpha-NTP-PPase superfamily)
MINSIDSARSRMTAKTAMMLEMQDRMNSRVDRDWLERGREWYRAIWIECAELMDHYGGWKWWKDSPREIDQVMLEIVDIWHFGLSMRITADRQYGSAAEQIVDEWHTLEDSNGFLRDVERLASVALREKAFLVAIVPVLLGGIGREFDDLYRAYIGKNVLNFFRQDHGYRDGSYRKIWQGREDNEHLVEILSALDTDDADYRERVYAALQQRYAEGDPPVASK